MRPLTNRQREALEAIRAAIHLGAPPTVRELAAALGAKSLNTASDLTRALERKGYVRRVPGQSRNLRLVERGEP